MLNNSFVSIHSQLNPLIQFLSDIIKFYWEQYSSVVHELPDGLKHVERKLEGEKVVIKNQCYQSTKFRKLHLELAKVGQESDIFHCVMFSNPSYSLPLFGCDIVTSPREVIAVIVDLFPANQELTLSSEYHQALSRSAVL